jgi:hypothetical protein
MDTKIKTSLINESSPAEYGYRYGTYHPETGKYKEDIPYLTRAKTVSKMFS